MNSSVKGAYLKTVDHDKSVKKYTKRGVSIIEEIGKCLPNDIEKLLVGANFEIFKKLYRRYSLNGQLGSLYNHFYIACYDHEITVTKRIDVPTLYGIRFFGNFFK